MADPSPTTQTPGHLVRHVRALELFVFLQTTEKGKGGKICRPTFVPEFR
ncbi:hypothetical protein FBZ88_10188 [Nitrospirillum bahiense]|uniref:Uncharacterized protein n=1 Tax=Nitrospirillum amazonense TaxID=28077 RepID=A0A560GCS6_9PROT|nr:hypothetical protein FBZ88_10188 [Nitrospirillum amazonense]